MMLEHPKGSKLAFKGVKMSSEDKKDDKVKEIFDEVQDKAEVIYEDIKVSGETVVGKVKELIREGNIRRIIIKNEEGKALLEIPMTLGVVGAAILPVYAALGVIGALIAKLQITIEKTVKDGELVKVEKPTQKKAKKAAKKEAKAKKKAKKAAKKEAKKKAK